MSSPFIAVLALPLALQGAPAAPDVSALSDLPIEQTAAPRCGIAFALVSRWQKADDPRGADYPDMEANGGREFFVRSMARLMEQQDLSRDALVALIGRELDALNEDEAETKVARLMPACALMKESAGL